MDKKIDRVAKPDESDRSTFAEASALTPLHEEIDARVKAIRETHPAWPCAKGCDHCCRQLADVPRLTANEWTLLKTGLRTLPPDRLDEIRQHMAALPETPRPPIVCPLLDRTSGNCPVYAQRPVACRTYGFYVQHGKGLYCRDIERLENEGSLADVLWGNYDAIALRLSGRGETRSMSEWFECWTNDA